MDTLKTRAILLCYSVGLAAISVPCAAVPPSAQPARPSASAVALSLEPGDVIATGNQWIALPEIGVDDGAIRSFNVLSMQEHGLLQVNGSRGAPALRPTLRVDGHAVALHGLHWSLLGYWVPVATVRTGNLLFTRFYAWGRTLDTEQLVGVTSRSPRYYVSAAYWDRDAMLWSFPGLLRSDPRFARKALEYALDTQLRDTGIHSRYIDGAVLEDGFELDEAAAPLIALAEYEHATGDLRFLKRHRAALRTLERGLLARKAASGLYRSVQDSQDENRAQQFMTYDNALVWRAFEDLSDLRTLLHEPRRAARSAAAARDLRAAILAQLVRAGAPGARGTDLRVRHRRPYPVFRRCPAGFAAAPAVDRVRRAIRARV